MTILSGRTLGRFQIREQIGAGGMGVVYAATDLQLGRPVAVKVLPLELTQDPVRRERFLREARSAAQVRHPAIAVVHDIGETEAAVYIVMELVEGQSLRAALGHGPPPLSHALALGASLAEAVAVAHRAGVIHRDLKPENLMIDRDGSLKILDFGIAKLDPQTWPGSEGMPVTRDGAAIGTPGYMSPEQARGVAVDHRTDIFAIGAILYELCSGRPPFTGQTPMDVLTATTRDEPAPLCALDPRIPPGVEALVHACMRKDPAARPADAANVATELRRLAAELRSMGQGASAASGPDWRTGSLAVAPTVAETPYAGALSASQSRKGVGAVVLVGLAGVLLLGGMAIAGGYYYFAPGASEGKAAAQLREPRVGLALLEAYLHQQDSKSEAKNTAPAWDAAAKDFRDAALQSGAPEEWSAYQRFAEGQKELHEGALDAAEQSFEASSKVKADWALPHLGLSTTYERRRDRKRALAAAQKAQQLDPELWLAVRAAARAYLVGEPDFPSAIQEYRRAKQMVPKNALLLSEIALAFHAARMDEEAVRHAKLALEADPDMVGARVLLAERALESKNGKEALKHASRAVSVAPDNVSALLAKGDALLLLGRKDEARTTFEQALSSKKKTKQSGAPDARLKQVEAALAKNALPSPRGEAAQNSPGAPHPRTHSLPSFKPPRSKSGGGGGDRTKTGDPAF